MKADRASMCHELVFDVTRRETFQNLLEIWMKEVDTYTTIEKSVRMVIGNKIDMVSARADEHAWWTPRSSILTSLHSLVHRMRKGR